MTSSSVGLTILGCIALVAVAAPAIAPHSADEQFRGHLYAPPMQVRIIDDAGRLRAPFVYALRLTNRLERRLSRTDRICGSLCGSPVAGLFSLPIRAMARCCYLVRTSLAETSSRALFSGPARRLEWR